MVPPLEDEHALPADVVAAVKSPGLTAIKVTIGVSGGGYTETRADIDGFTKAISGTSRHEQRSPRAGAGTR